MKLDKNKFALAGSVTLTISFLIINILCRFIFCGRMMFFRKMMPFRKAMRHHEWMMKIDQPATGFYYIITFGRFLVQLVFVFALTYAIFWFFAWFYNKLLKK